MIRLIIFDLDGTLVDSSVDLTNALNFAVEPYGFERLTVEKTISLVGEGITRLIEKLLGPEHIGLQPDVMDRFMEFYSVHLIDFTRPYPGVVETLRNLTGYKKAVISNKRESLSRNLLQDLGLLRHFDAVLGSDSTGERKPSPKSLLKVMEMLSCRAEETVIVGDSNYDIEAGKAAGVKTIAVSYGYRDAGLLQDADRIISRFSDLDHVLGVIDAQRNNS
jgi:phosphoglycolate phosphatase